MSLFTDGNLSQESELQDRESSILSTAVLEGVDTGAKRALAQDDIGSQVQLFLLRDSWLDPRRLTRRMGGLCDVVVSAPLKKWHTEVSIAMIYSDAYSTQLNDRYLVKLTQYEDLARESALKYFLTGVALVYDPIAKAACASLTAVNGEAGSATYYFALAWLNAAGQEGAPSDVVSITTSAGSVPMLTATTTPLNAQGWSIYGATDPQSLALQYSGALPTLLPTPLTWTLPVSGLISGRPPGTGQIPELFVVNESRIQRG
jgi:hypothetical protein